MPYSGLLQDPTNAKVLLHLLYSGPKTNKQIARDFSVMRIRTKTGVLIRGHSGYHYIRSATKKLEKAGLIKAIASVKEKVYGFNLDCNSGILTRIFSLRGFKDWEYIHNNIGFTPEHLNRILRHTLFRRTSKPAFKQALGTSEHRSRSFLYNYKKRLENGTKDVVLAVLVFITDVTSSIIEVEPKELWNTIHNKGIEELRRSIRRDFNAYNWRNLPTTMIEDIERSELDTYIEGYKKAVDEKVLNSVINLWQIKTGFSRDDVLELVAYTYLIERLFIYFTYCRITNKDMERIRAIGPSPRAIEVGDRDEKLVASWGFKATHDALKRLNRDVKNVLASDQKMFVLFEGSLRTEKEFVELVRLRYEKEAAVEEKREKDYSKATGKERRGLSLSSAMRIATKKKLPMHTIKTIDLVQFCVRLYGTRSLRGIKTLVHALSSAGYGNYFERVREMYRMKLPHKSDK